MGESVHRKVLRRISSHAGLRLFRFFARPLQAQSESLTSSGLDVRLLSEPETTGLCREHDLDLREAAVATAYSRGDLCVGAYDGRLLAGYCWLAFAPLHHLDGVSVKFDPEVAWVYKSFVRSSHRGRGIAPRLYCFADTDCRARGRTISLVCVESHNASSIGAALRAGYSDSGRAAYLRRGPLFADWYSAPVRERGVSFFVAKGAQLGAALSSQGH
jgi:GNAT superfamily N-acetyltransferase